MALPFYLPGEDAELHLRRLERLLRELYHVLHALLAGGATVRGPARDRQPPPPPPPGPPAPQSAGSSRAAPGGPAKPPASQRSPAYWSGLGAELRLIADSLRDSRPRPPPGRGAATA